MLFGRVSARPEVKLAPAELAYLARAGDMTHTMVVLGFDLFHRALKRGDRSEPLLLPYEERLWQKTKQFVQEKGRNEVDKLVPLPKSANPVEILVKLSGSYRFLTDKVRQIVRQILSDPRQLRAYFSPAALGRFVADVFSSGYKDLVSSEIVELLTERGLLLSKKRREELAAWLLIIAALGFALLINIAWSLTPDLKSFLLLLFMACVNAVCFKLVSSILTVMPLYDEVTLVLKHIPMRNYVARLCGLLSLVIRILLITLIVLFGLLLLCVDLLIFLLFSAHGAWTLLFDVVVLTANFYVLLSILLDSLGLSMSPKLSSFGQDLVAQRRKELSDANIVESFKEILVSSSYDAKVSEILAVYGYETLWLMT